MNGIEEQVGYIEKPCAYCEEIYNENALCEDCLGCPECCYIECNKCEECGWTEFELIQYAYRKTFADIYTHDNYDNDWEMIESEYWCCSNCGTRANSGAKEILFEMTQRR